MQAYYYSTTKDFTGEVTLSCIIARIATLSAAAKKHQTDIMYSPKNNLAMIKDSKLMHPNQYTLFVSDKKAGKIVGIK